jgi:hypothetical protein
MIKYKVLEPSKLFIFYCKYSFKELSHSALFIMNFSQLYEKIVVFIINYSKF